MDRKDIRFRCRAESRNRVSTSKRSCESLAELQVVPNERPHFQCEQCGFVNTLIPMCLWCSWTSEEAKLAFQLSLPRVRRISAPHMAYYGTQLDRSSSELSPRAHIAARTDPEQRNIHSQYMISTSVANSIVSKPPRTQRYFYISRSAKVLDEALVDNLNPDIRHSPKRIDCSESDTDMHLPPLSPRAPPKSPRQSLEINPGEDKTILKPKQHEHMPTLRRKKTNLNIQTLNLHAIVKEPIPITLNLPYSAETKITSSGPFLLPPSPFDAHVVKRLSMVESESGDSRLSSLNPPASVRIGHPSRPYYSAIRGPHGIAPPSSRPTSTDGLPRRRRRPQSLDEIAGEPGTLDPSIDNATRTPSATRHLSMSACSPASPPKYSAFALPSDSDDEEEDTARDAGGHPPSPSPGRLFFSLAARTRRRPRMSFGTPATRASGNSASETFNAMAHGHAHASFTQSLSRVGGTRYRGSSGGMGFSMSGQTELRMALAEGSASAGVEERGFKFRETGPPPPEPDPGAGGKRGSSFMNRVRKLRNSLKDMLLA